MREASTEDVGNRILHSYGMWEGLEKQFVVSPMILAMIYLLISDCQYRESSNSTCVEKTYNYRICGSYTFYWTIVAIYSIYSNWNNILHTHQ